MTFDVVVEKIRAAIANLIDLISEFFKKFDIKPNYEKTDKWTDKYPYEEDAE